MESVDAADQALDVGFVADQCIGHLRAGRIRANGRVHANLLLAPPLCSVGCPTPRNAVASGVSHDRGVVVTRDGLSTTPPLHGSRLGECSPVSPEGAPPSVMLIGGRSPIAHEERYGRRHPRTRGPL